MEGFLAASEAKDQDTFPFLLVSRTLEHKAIVEINVWQHASCWS